jgi:nucleotide-binding universal stress UspA family protein
MLIVGIKDILVYIDDSAASESRLDLAVLYAQKHDANLRGLYLITHAYYESRDLSEKSNLARVESIFREKTAKAGVSFEWIVFDSSVVGVDITDIVINQGYFSDLVIVGQSNSHTPIMNIPSDFLERLVRATGRPVLVVPYAGVFETAGDRIVIGWKAGRESVRSLGDAMPHLIKSHHVSVVGVSADENFSESDKQITKVSSYLLRHDVSVQTDLLYTGNLSIADTILNIVCERTADLLVIGAYAPNRRGVLVFSPVAVHIIKHLTAPVLLSH